MKKQWIRRIVVIALSAILLATPAFATVGGATVKTVTGGLNLRSGPSTGTAVKKLLQTGDFMLVEEKLDGWYKVVVDGTEGYVCADYVNFSDSIDGTYNYNASTKGTYVNMRAGAALWCWVYKNLPNYGTPLTVTGVTGNWLKVRDESGTEGYIRSDLVSYIGSAAAPATTTTTYTATTSYTAPAATTTTTTTPSASPASSYSGDSQIVATAMQYLGYRYIWGGMSPAYGFDCSGLVCYVYQQNGYQIDRVAQNIYNNTGRFVEYADMQPGDILCFGYSAYSIGHCGIYIGNGQFIHACDSSTGVIISNLTDGAYLARLMGIKRVVG